jgi:hypothetical protein
MSIKQKFSREKTSAKDRESNRNFLVLIVLVTVALMALVYYVFV